MQLSLCTCTQNQQQANTKIFLKIKAYQIASLYYSADINSKVYYLTEYKQNVNS